MADDSAAQPDVVLKKSDEQVTGMSEAPQGHHDVNISYIETRTDPKSDLISAMGSNIDDSITAIPSTPSGSPSPTRRGAWAGQAAKIPEDRRTSAKTAITKTDVANIFRHTVTTGTVTNEEIARVKQMHDRISEGVNFNFNYYCLIGIASILAALGLASNNSTTIISSMLLSPIMGPVIGMSYGTVIWDLKLVRRSWRNEGVSLIVCIILGMLVGILCSWTEMAKDWPTEEMLTRGEVQNFLIALPVAFFSGLGVALSVLDDQTSSLVGVAISASLLPPAVNAGLLWVFSGMKQSDPLEERLVHIDTNFVQMGGISLALTVSNVVLVWLAGALMFRIKEVLPIKKKVFWDDLKTARRIYQRRALLAEEEDDDDNSHHE